MERCPDKAFQGFSSVPPPVAPPLCHCPATPTVSNPHPVLSTDLGLAPPGPSLPSLGALSLLLLLLAASASPLLFAPLHRSFAHVYVFPLLELLVASVVSSVPLLRTALSRASPPLPRLAGCRPPPPLLLALAPLAFLAVWARALLAARFGLGLWLAFDSYALPIAVLALPLLPSLPMPHLHLRHPHPLAALVVLATVLVLLNQPLSPLLLLLGFASAALEAFHLLALLAFLLAFPHLSPWALLARIAPLALLFSLLPALADEFYRAFNHLPSLPLVPPLSLSIAPSLLLFLLLRLAERSLQILALLAIPHPLPILLLHPLRNILLLSSAHLFRLFVGLNGVAQAIALYTFILILSPIRLLIHEAPHPHLPLPRHSTDHHHLPLVDAVQPLESEALTPQKKQAFSSSLNSPLPSSSCSSSCSSIPPWLFLGPHHSPSRHSPDHMAQLWKRGLLLATLAAPLGLFLLSLFSPPSVDLEQSHLAGPGTRISGREFGSVDIVLSYYNEPMGNFTQAVRYVKQVKSWKRLRPRLIVYVKSSTVALDYVASQTGADEVARLPNLGREGGTYLTHILRHYNQSISLSSAHSPQIVNLALDHEQWVTEHLLVRPLRDPDQVGFADHTVFMQPEITWSWVAKPRMDMFDPFRTGFLSFGPYLKSVCGEDGWGKGNYQRVKDIFVIFQQTFCPPSGQLASYAGQFVVSRKRILSNTYQQYFNLKSLLEAPTGHWIHEEDWLRWKGATDGEDPPPKGPQAPFLGHALERSWPVIFGCVDPVVAEKCPERHDVKDDCQCFDI